MINNNPCFLVSHPISVTVYIMPPPKHFFIYVKYNIEIHSWFLCSQTAMVISGKELARQIHKEIQCDVEEWVSLGNKQPHLSVIVVGDNPASHIYVRNKTRAAAALGESVSSSPCFHLWFSNRPSALVISWRFIHSRCNSSDVCIIERNVEYNQTVTCQNVQSCCNNACTPLIYL